MRAIIALLIIFIFLLGCTQEIKSGHNTAEPKEIAQEVQPASPNITPDDGLDAAIQDLDTVNS